MRNQFLIGLSFAAIAIYSCMGDFGMVHVIAAGNAAEIDYAPQINNERQVKITAILQNIPKDAKTWDSELVLETHTHALSETLENSSVLIADGKQYLPLGWEGSPPGGHHRKGMLRFKAIAPQPASMELQIRLIGEPAPRSFKWRLK
ncbi:MAG: hypothetical protein ACOY9D_09320 [Pseudomonadota bacterium]